MPRGHILVLDDEPTILTTLQKTLTLEGYGVDVAGGIKAAVSRLSIDTRWVDAMPTALIKPLSGGGARGMMVDTMKALGPDSFAGRLSCVLQGSTETTFYVLAVYFGSVGVKQTRHALGCALASEMFGVLAAVAVTYLFFG